MLSRKACNSIYESTNNDIKGIPFYVSKNYLVLLPKSLQAFPYSSANALQTTTPRHDTNNQWSVQCRISSKNQPRLFSLCWCLNNLHFSHFFCCPCSMSVRWWKMLTSITVWEASSVIYLRIKLSMNHLVEDLNWNRK